MKKLEILSNSIPQDNAILVDWLTVTFHDIQVSDVKRLLGLDAPDIDWDERLVFQDGYPRQCTFANITIRYGADNAENYTNDKDKSAADKVRYDMGISLNMSGNGCRSFETYGSGDWLDLFTRICNLETRAVFTRLDLAFDDHTGILDINRIRQDVEDRNYTGSPKIASFVWKDDQETDIQGLTVYVGSRKSPIFVRIYNKAAERGFNDRHWIRVEICMRKDRAMAAVAEILKLQDVGKTFCGVLRNYCCFRESAADTNKSRWPIADYWEKLLQGAERIRLWISPGEPYNFQKTEDQLIFQYGQALQAFVAIHGNIHILLKRSREAHPDLKKKYQMAIDDAKLQQRMYNEQIKKLRLDLGIVNPEDHWHQLDLAEIQADMKYLEKYGW